KAHLRRKVFAAVRYVHRRHSHAGDVDGDDAVLVIKGRMNKLRALRRDGLADVQPDPRVALAAVPVAPVPLHLAKGGRHLVGSSFDFLQADDIRALALDPLLHLALARADAVDVPGGDFNGWRARPAARSARLPSARDARQRAPERSLRLSPSRRGRR